MSREQQRRGGPIAHRMALDRQAAQRAEALQLLQQACRHPLPQVRARAARTLGRLRARKGVSDLIRLLRDPTGRVRYVAAIALGRLGGKRAIRALVAVVQRPDRECYAALGAIEGLGQIGKPAIGALVAVLNPCQRGLCERVCQCLARIGDRSALRSVTPLLYAADPEVRRAAIEAVAAFGGAEGLDFLESCQMDLEPSVRALAAYHCQRMREALLLQSYRHSDAPSGRNAG